MKKIELIYNNYLIINYLIKLFTTGKMTDTRKMVFFTTGNRLDTRKRAKFTTGNTPFTRKMAVFTTGKIRCTPVKLAKRLFAGTKRAEKGTLLYWFMLHLTSNICYKLTESRINLTNIRV